MSLCATQGCGFPAGHESEHPHGQPIARRLKGTYRGVPWARCMSCGGTCHWHDEAWVCDGCGDEWFPEHGSQYEIPTEDKEA